MQGTRAGNLPRTTGMKALGCMAASLGNQRGYAGGCGFGGHFAHSHYGGLTFAGRSSVAL